LTARWRLKARHAAQECTFARTIGAANDGYAPGLNRGIDRIQGRRAVKTDGNANRPDDCFVLRGHRLPNDMFFDAV
jgi:hypothetical protein